MSERQNRILEKIKLLTFFKIATKVNARENANGMLTEEEIRKIQKDKEIYVQNTDVTISNWDELKEEFLKQRLNKYPKEYPYKAKIKFELREVEGLNFKGDYEVLKDEYREYLQGWKENKKKAGRKSIPKKTAEAYLKVSEDNQSIFLDKLKQKFSKSDPKEFAYFIISLEDLELIEIDSQKNVFEAFEEAFGGHYGSESNFGNHYRSQNDKELLESTNKKITAIKKMNVIT